MATRPPRQDNESPCREHNESPWKIWIEFWREAPFIATLLAVLFLLSLAFAFFALAAGGWYLWNFHTLLDRNDGQQEWGGFSTFMGFVVQAVVGGATLVAAFLLSGVLTDRLERRRAKEAQSREIVRLSEKMVDTEFYIKVMYPAWEVALKWMDDDMPGIDAYRADVVGAEMRLPKIYRQRQGRLALAENNPRTHPHYQPYDVSAPTVKDTRGPSGTAVISELSESLAFATWIRFWRNVRFLIEKKLIESDAARALFREWYLWWAPFMTEFLHVCDEVRTRVYDQYELCPDAENWAQSSIRKLLELHGDLGISLHAGHESEGALYRRVGQVVDGMMGQITDAIDHDPNYELVGKDLIAARRKQSTPRRTRNRRAKATP